MAAKLTRLTHKIAIQLHLAAESYTILSSRSRRPVRKLLDTPCISEIHAESQVKRSRHTCRLPGTELHPSRARSIHIITVLTCSYKMSLRVQPPQSRKETSHQVENGASVRELRNAEGVNIMYT